jgi:hypothetical protein
MKIIPSKTGKNMTKDGRVRTSELLGEVQKIVSLTEYLRKIVDALPDSSVKDAYELSATNLEKKNARFLAQEKIGKDEREIAQLVKQGKFELAQEKLAEIRARRENSGESSEKTSSVNNSTDQKNDGSSARGAESSAPAKKGGKKH